MRQPVETGVEPAKDERRSLRAVAQHRRAQRRAQVSELKAEMPTEIATVSAN